MIFRKIVWVTTRATSNRTALSNQLTADWQSNLMHNAMKCEWFIWLTIGLCHGQVHEAGRLTFQVWMDGNDLPTAHWWAGKYKWGCKWLTFLAQTRHECDIIRPIQQNYLRAPGAWPLLRNSSIHFVPLSGK